MSLYDRRRCERSCAGVPPFMESKPGKQRLSRLAHAVEAYLDHREDPRRDDASFLESNEELRDLLEAMIDEDLDADLDTDLDDVGVDGGASAASKPRFLGDYRLIRELGRGGMGVVYEAEQLSLSRRVALKVLPSHATLSASEVKRFRREAAAAAKLHHDGIVPIHAIGSVDGAHFYAMEFVEGSTLHEAIEAYAERGSLGVKRGTSRSAEAAEIARQVAEALDYSHRAGVVHRDVKPHNIMIDTKGRARLVDFGLAKELDVDVRSQTLSGAGTPFYMSPEQVDEPGVVDERTDVFSLGVVLYEMLVGTRPFEGESTQQVMRAVTTQDITRVRDSNAAVPRDLETICLKALEKDVDMRYASAHAFAADLRRFLAHEPIHAKPPATAVRLAKLVRRHRVVSLALAVVVIVVLCAASMILTQAKRQAARDRANMARSENAIRSLLDVALSTTIPRRAGDERRALRRLEEAAFICGDLVEHQGKAASTDLRRRYIDLLTHLGEFYRQRAEREKALEAHAKALTLARQLSRELPRSGMIVSLCAVSFTHYYGLLERVEWDVELDEFDRLIERMRAAPPEVDPTEERDRQRRIAAALSWRGVMRFDDRYDLRGVREDLETAEALWLKQPRTVTSLSGTGWFMNRMHLAHLELVEGRREKAEGLLTEAWREFSPLLDADAGNALLRSEAALYHAVHARVLESLGERAAAMRACRSAIAVRKGLATDFPRSTENARHLASAEVVLAVALVAKRDYSRAIRVARKALEHIALASKSTDAQHVRASIHSVLASAMMHAARHKSQKDVSQSGEAREIEENFSASLEIRRVLVNRFPDSTEFAFSLASTACNAASWFLHRAELERAVALAQESFDYGRAVVERRDPALPESVAKFRLQAHILVSCLVRDRQVERCFEVAGQFASAQAESPFCYVNAAMFACRALKVLVQSEAGDVRALAPVYSKTAIAWLREGAKLNRAVLQKAVRHPAFAVLANEAGFVALCDEVHAPRRGAAKGKSAKGAAEAATQRPAASTDEKR